jgi:hypothetical protein
VFLRTQSAGGSLWPLEFVPIEVPAVVVDKGMAEVFGNGGDSVIMGGQYECSECGHRVHLATGEIFPPDHHPQRPWTLYVKD